MNKRERKCPTSKEKLKYYCGRSRNCNIEIISNQHGAQLLWEIKIWNELL